MRKHFDLFACLFVILFASAHGAHSAVPSLSDRAVRVAEKSVSIQVPQTAGQFFNTLEPRASFRGAVKTFTIRSRSLFSAPNQIRVFPNREIETPASGVEHKTWNGGLMMPVSGELSSPFGYRKSPFGRRIEFHSGIDLRAPRGTPIHAAAPGKVVFSGWKRGYGMTLEIEHANGIRTVYAHCSRLLATLGSSIQGGATIAQVGTTGSTTGSHLHFEVMRNNRLFNPIAMLRR
ncbi:MAG: M23 family metallopeptidase [Candidatus Ozemobacteraceae bacterium]